MRIYESKYLMIDYLADLNINEQTWTDQNVRMTEEECKNEFTAIAQNAAKMKVHGLLASTLNFQFVISPQVQEWTDKNIFPQYLASGIRKIAYIVPTDFFVNVSIEQLMDEEKGKEFQVVFFDTREKAIEWLKK